MIIEKYDESLFIQRFENMNRVETSNNPNGNFSYKGLRAEEEFFEAVEEETGGNTTLIKFGDDLNEGFIIGQY